jgi:hypothetical protein
MAFIEMFRPRESEKGNFDNFDCPTVCWDELRNLGEKFDWRPLGTVSLNKIREADERLWRVEVEANLRPDWREFLQRPRPSDPARQSAHFEERSKYLRYDLYQPREYGDDRELTDDDAIAWAAALERALEAGAGDILASADRGVVITESAPPLLNRQALSGLTSSFIVRFLEYAKRGGFGFAYSF